MRSLSDRVIAALTAMMTLPTIPVTNETYHAWKGGEGWRRALPRVEKHRRRGVYAQSETRKARRLRQVENGAAGVR